jgi:MtrB/PioB family decaheme-associated outer membrane protein
MRRLVLSCVCGVVLAVPAVARAQATPPAKPAPQPAAQAAAAPPEIARGLFDETWRQFFVGGRFSSIDGDPARYQRYGDFRDGLLFTNARWANEDAAGKWSYKFTADNTGYRDQRYFGEYDRVGRFRISGLWDEIPQFYSVDTKTPFTTASDGALVLDDATQLAIQNGQATTTAYVSQAPQFDLHERRDIGTVNMFATPTRTIDLRAAFTTTRHVGELPWGASFGFSNDVEVALPYDSRTNDINLGAEWNNSRQMLRVGYSGSWFENLDDTLVWDSPLRLTDASTVPGRGRMALWPSNSAQTVSIAGHSKFKHRTQLSGFLSFGSWNNDEPLQPFTINSATTQLALPRLTTEANAQIFSTNIGLVSRPNTDWRMSARFRHYGYDNQTPHTDIPQFINYDSSVKISTTGGPEPYSHSRTNFDADATWSGLRPLALTVGYAHNKSGHEFRIFEDTGENVLSLTADAVGSQWLTFRARYELADKTGSGLDEALLVQIGEQPALRHYDIANRGRQRFTGQVDIAKLERWIFSVTGGVGEDNYDDSYFGLQKSTFGTFSFSADFQNDTGFGAGGSYTYEQYGGFQTSRSASPGSTPPQENDPNRDWTTDSKERVHYFSIYATPPKFGEKTEARISYDFSFAEGNYFYGVVPGGPLPAPSQLPNVHNKLQQLKVDVRHRLSRHWAASVAYLYEPFDVYDFALDPTVVNGIVQPSSLVLGYVYRPYTAHTGVVGLRYVW